MRAVIAGVAGVGKSSVLELVAKKTQYDIVNYGTLMFEMAKEINLVTDRDQLRKLEIGTQINLQKKASSAIGKMENVIIDTHMAVKSPKGYLPGLPEWVLRELKVSVYFLIEADPELIMSRRAKDPKRARDEDSVDQIVEHQTISRMFAIAYAVYSGATVDFIDNPEGNPAEAANRIIEELKANA